MVERYYLERLEYQCPRIIICFFCNTVFEVMNMKKEREKEMQKKCNEEFNSITQKVKPENQNQHHNVRKEAVDAKRRQV